MEINSSLLVRNIKNSNSVNKETSKINIKRNSSIAQKYNILNNINKNINNKNENKKLIQQNIESLMTDNISNFQNPEQAPKIPKSKNRPIVSRNVIQNKILLTNNSRNNFLSTSSMNNVITQNNNNNNDALTFRDNTYNTNWYYNLKGIFKNCKTNNNSRNNIKNDGNKGNIYSKNNSMNTKRNNKDPIFKVIYKYKKASGENVLIESKIKNMKNNKNYNNNYNNNYKKLKFASIPDTCSTEREIIEENSNNNNVLSIPIINNESQYLTDRNNYNNFNTNNRVFKNTNKNINNSHILTNLLNNIKVNNGKKPVSRNKSIKLIPFGQSKNSLSY